MSRARLLTPVLVFVTLVTAVVSSLGAPLTPLISRDLHLSLSTAQWSLTAALLAGTVSAPIMGRLGDGRRRRETLLGGLAVVLAGGVVAALSGGSFGLLVAGRAMQGVGLGLVPLAIAAARDGLPAREVPAAVALLSVSAAAGVGAGYPISGLIAEHLDLHAAFWFGAAVSAVALATVAAILPASTAREAGRLDGPGAVLLSAGLVALLIAVADGTEWGWGSTRILGLLAAAVLLLCAWGAQQLRVAAPLVDLRLLRDRTVLTADASALVLGVAMYVNLSAVTSFVQIPSSSGYGFGASELVAGLCLVPFSITTLLASRALPWATRLLGPLRVLPVGCLVVAAAGTFLALLHGALWEAFAGMAIIGVGLGFTFAAIPGLIVAAVPREEVGSAMGFYQVVRYVGFSLGSAVAAAVLAGHTPAGRALPTESGYTLAFAVSAVVCVVAAVVAWVLPTRRAAPAVDHAARELEVQEAELAAAGVVGREGAGASAVSAARPPAPAAAP